jgi:hypothetical protein
MAGLRGGDADRADAIVAHRGRIHHREDNSSTKDTKEHEEDKDREIEEEQARTVSFDVLLRVFVFFVFLRVLRG